MDHQSTPSLSPSRTVGLMSLQDYTSLLERETGRKNIERLVLIKAFPFLRSKNPRNWYHLYRIFPLDKEYSGCSSFNTSGPPTRYSMPNLERRRSIQRSIYGLLCNKLREWTNFASSRGRSQAQHLWPRVLVLAPDQPTWSNEQQWQKWLKRDDVQQLTDAFQSLHDLMRQNKQYDAVDAVSRHPLGHSVSVGDRICYPSFDSRLSYTLWFFLDCLNWLLNLVDRQHLRGHDLYEKALMQEEFEQEIQQLRNDNDLVKAAEKERELEQLKIEKATLEAKRPRASQLFILTGRKEEYTYYKWLDILIPTIKKTSHEIGESLGSLAFDTYYECQFEKEWENQEPVPSLSWCNRIRAQIHHTIISTPEHLIVEWQSADEESLSLKEASAILAILQGEEPALETTDLLTLLQLLDKGHTMQCKELIFACEKELLRRGKEGIGGRAMKLRVFDRRISKAALETLEFIELAQASETWQPIKKTVEVQEV